MSKMWLLDTKTYQLHEFTGDQVNPDDTPYAILSHVWGNEEITFQEMLNQTAEVRSKPGYRKVTAFCDIVRDCYDYQYRYAWIDTACIDKRSSAELNENINSMYKYYSDASICMVYLADVESPIQSSKFSSSQWFKRGWTLQELVASKDRRFFASNWSEITNYTLRSDVLAICAQRTGIHLKVLSHERPIESCCVAERMSWAADRRTKKPEDRAYSLIGIFGVNLSVLYGEGLQRAFARLQAEIMKMTFDQSLFAWRGSRDGDEGGLLAQSPDDFHNSPAFGLWHPGWMFAPFVRTNIGVSFRPQVYSKEGLEHVDEIQAALQLDVRTEKGWMIPTIRLRRVPGLRCWADGKQQTAWRRIECGNFGLLKRGQLDGHHFKDVIVLENEHHQLLQASIEADRSRQEENVWGEDPHAKLPPAWQWH